MISVKISEFRRITLHFVILLSYLLDSKSCWTSFSTCIVLSSMGLNKQ
jgi:hypothetical protein